MKHFWYYGAVGLKWINVVYLLAVLCAVATMTPTQATTVGMVGFALITLFFIFTAMNARNTR